MCDRGDITLWLSQEAIDTWPAPKTGKRGGQRVYADIAIETALALRLLFRLPLRQTEGFLRSVLTLIDLALPCPDHTTLSRQSATLVFKRLDNRTSPGPVHLIADSSGLQVCGQGEWHAKKHGEKRRKRSNPGIGSAPVVSRQLQAEFKRSFLFLFDSCNKITGRSILLCL